MAGGVDNVVSDQIFSKDVPKESTSQAGDLAGRHRFKCRLVIL